MNCIDVGAHVGVITSKLLRYAPRGAHLAVEPTPWKAERLKRLFPRVGVHACALGARPGRANFSENVRRPALSRLARADGGASSNDIRTYEVEIKTLDMIALEAPKTGFIKIDAEGAEPDVIRGGSGLIARDRPAILFEWGADEEETARLRPDPYQVLTGEFGYDVYSIRSFIFGRRKLNHYDFDVCRTYPATAFNFVALPGG
jgi:FkbM family methyltransferase